MNRTHFTKKACFVALLLCLLGNVSLYAKAYDNFKVSIYVRAYEVDKMKDMHWLDSTWTVISQQLDVDKIYLETHRDLLLVDDATLEQAKKFFHERGIETAGGITYTIDEANSFETFCYSNPEHRKMVQHIAEHTARHLTSSSWTTSSYQLQVRLRNQGQGQAELDGLPP